MLPTLNATRAHYAASSRLQKVHDLHDQNTHIACSMRGQLFIAQLSNVSGYDDEILSIAILAPEGAN